MSLILGAFCAGVSTMCAKRLLVLFLAGAVLAVAVTMLPGRAIAFDSRPGDPDREFADGGIASGIIGSDTGPRWMSLFVRGDGKLLVGYKDNYYSLRLLSSAGAPDATYQIQEGMNQMYRRCNAIGGGCWVEAITLQASGEVLAGVTYTGAEGGARFGLSRFLADGSLDVQFGLGGVGFSAQVDGGQASALALLRDGLVLVGGTTSTLVPGEATLAFARFTDRGIADQSFGDGGVVKTRMIGRPLWLLPAPDGSVVVVAVIDASSNRPMDVPKILLVRLLAGGQYDFSFGNAGTVVYDVDDGSTWPSKALLEPDGRILIAVRHGLEGSQGGVRQFTFLRFLPDGTVDDTFGVQGKAVLKAGEDDTESQAEDVALQADGKILGTGTVYQARGPTGFRRIALARLNHDGSPDPTFAAGGVALAWSQAGADGYALATSADRRIWVAAQIEGPPQLVHVPDLPPIARWIQVFASAVLAFINGEAPAQYARQATAVEYHHSGFDHYFVTAIAYEIALLDTDPQYSALWTRTNQQFRVHTERAPELSPMCRFFSSTTFAPKSSHFYTPYDWECAIVRADPAWLFEGEVFMVRLPGLQGMCSSGTVALYRLYNNGQGDAPNHRYTTDASIWSVMITQGWIPEGAGIGVIACVPP